MMAKTNRHLMKVPKEKWDALLRYGASSLPGYLSVGKRADFVNYATVLDYVEGKIRQIKQPTSKII